MKRQDPGLEPELEAFLEHPKVERHAPAELRARVLARARAIVAAERAVPTEALPPARPAALAPAAPGRALLRFALAACIALVGAAVAAAAALHNRSVHAPAPPVSDSPSEPPSAPSPTVASPPREPPEPRAPPAATIRAARPGRTAAKADVYTAELDLLQRAHAAYTRRDFSTALALAAEHARRFPRGHLAEQREALRVRSLVGSGRTDEAHSAAAAFAVQFPRSVLLPRVEEGPESAKP